jgi:glutathione reductase (NADPH)
MTELQFDVLVIGTGTAGYGVAEGCVRGGKKTAIVDKAPYGGTCALRGCQPKKIMVSNTEPVALSKHLLGDGIKTAAQTDWGQLQAKREDFTSAVPAGTEKGFEHLGITTLHGRASFSGPDTVEVTDPETGDKKEFRAENIVVATGARPRPLDVPGEEYAVDSDGFLYLRDLPQRIVFIGGGYISFEFAHIAAQAGAEAVILHRSEQVLKQFDPDLVDTLVEASKTEGIDIRTSSPVTAVREENGRYTVETGAGDSFIGDLVVSAAGRIPELEDLNLEAGNVEASKRGVRVNRYMQSVSNPKVYAVGDAAAKKYPLSPVADMEAQTAAKNIVEGNRTEADYSVVPSVVFTHPPLARVGLSEAEAKNRGGKFRTHGGNASGWAASKRIGQKYAAYKLIIDEEEDQLAGAHLLGHDAGEVINIFALALKYSIPLKDLKEMPWAYPTYVSDIKYML